MEKRRSLRKLLARTPRRWPALEQRSTPPCANPRRAAPNAAHAFPEASSLRNFFFCLQNKGEESAWRVREFPLKGGSKVARMC